MNGQYKAFWMTSEGFIEILDQTKLPFVEDTVILRTADDAIAAIKDMLVRGAGVIGNIAALGVYLAAKEHKDLKYIVSKANDIRESRPTAVNLMWAVDIMLKALASSRDDLVEVAYATAN